MSRLFAYIFVMITTLSEQIFYVADTLEVLKPRRTLKRTRQLPSTPNPSGKMGNAMDVEVPLKDVPGGMSHFLP